MSVQAAVDYTVGLIEDSYRIVNAAEARLPKLDGKAKEDLDTYIEQCKDQAAGSIYFQYGQPSQYGQGGLANLTNVTIVNTHRDTFPNLLSRETKLLFNYKSVESWRFK
ncbi:hypothetical protein H112_02225 [Trichophyton rubrum D6]|uniref:Uncharacterized protein n=3 Tax=Trichophyton TaxID=5550 RepID=A0A080WNV7_TRIRC|nr:uncharacterized protein TERG_12496 [Trichophyton rubrum CBS 118892]EZF25496.1 hypothetical protein H100_02225 [Trichophyton rubrum MR850]EZF44507.1 hypothetical protein H102_02222 [Trichophyton rubrum CBS 100081]EZF55175.1 hypothetical protein H103_02231 [Trichophyton rubrum CBS 288.86]EZF65792.1 hypothetical protein H104_02206 [Trichophyton rubrum CBS 289.86]EZF76397.1 hypothetical protein H105_02242 [Trichophyton soudanense CBS 452.61]EZF87070.1 hypothetical protein H110_02228 [Trichophy